MCKHKNKQKANYMKKLFIALLLTISFNNSFSQYITGLTVVPQYPTSNDFIKIIADVTTPNLGDRISQNYFINYADTIIDLSSCYIQSVLTQPEQFLDTFLIGPIFPGTYKVYFTASLSTVFDSCNFSQSHYDSIVFTVSDYNSINNFILTQTFSVIPNPAFDNIKISSNNYPLTISFIDIKGVEIKTIKITGSSYIDIGDLPNGIYFLKAINKISCYTTKLIKTGDR